VDTLVKESESRKGTDNSYLLVRGLCPLGKKLKVWFWGLQYYKGSNCCRFNLISGPKGRTLVDSGNRALRRIFETKRMEVALNWRRLHNEELHEVLNLPNIISVTE
jgi:hypothetical protein